MQILYLAQFSGSPEHGMVHAYYYLAREWLRLGHKVTIVAASYAHPRGKQPETKSQVTEQWIDGIRYLWVPTNEYKPENHVGRGKNIIQFVAKTWFGSLPIKYADLVICSSHHPFAIFPARRLAKKFNAKLVFEVRDLWPLSLIELGGISPSNPFIWLMQKAENYAYRNSDHVVSVLSGSKTYMVEHGMAPDKFSFIPNGFPVNTHVPSPLPREMKHQIEQAKISSDLLIGYAGGINSGNSFKPLLEAVSILKNIKVTVIFLGEGPTKSLLVEYAKELGINDQVIFLGSVKKAAVANFLKFIDVAYVGFNKRDFYRYGVSPTKLNDYMDAGVPVIYAIDAPDDPVAESGCGLSCRAENSDDIAQAIEKLASMSVNELKSMGKRGKSWLLENRDYEKLAKRFLDEVRT